MATQDQSNLNLDFQFFFYQIKAFLQDNINISLISILSNMLALDHSLRFMDMKNIPKEQYVEKSIKRLKIYLAGKFIENTDFSTAMNLFIIAISEEDVYTEDKTMLAEYIVENVVDVSKEKLAESKKLIKRALEENQQEVFDLINSQPQKLSEILGSANKEHDLMSDIKKSNLDNQMANQQSIEDKSVYSLIGSGMVAAIGVATASIFGGIAPFIIIPAAILSLKMGAEAGEKVADKIYNHELKMPAFDKISSVIQKKIELIANAVSKTKSVKIEIENSDLQRVSNILSDIAPHLNGEENKALNPSHVKNIAKNQTKDTSRII